MGAKSQQSRAAIMVFCGGACFGIMGSCYQIAYQAGFSWPQVALAQMLFASLYFALATFFDKKALPWRSISLRSYLELAALGLLSFLTTSLYCFALTKLPVPVGLTILFQYSWLGIPLQLIFYKKGASKYELIAAALIVFGTLFASGILGLEAQALDTVALIAVICAAVTSASYLTFNGHFGQDVGIYQRGFVICAAATLANFILCPNFIQTALIEHNILPYALVIAAFGAFLPNVFFGSGAPHLNPATAALLASSELPLGLMVSSTVLAEQVVPLQWLGVVIILAGVGLSSLGSLKLQTQE